MLVELSKGVYRNKSKGGGECARSAKKNLSRKLKTFVFLDTLKVQIHYTDQLPYKEYFISPSSKTSRKKQQINVFNTLHSFIFKIVIALSSRGGGLRPLLYRFRQGHSAPPALPVYALDYEHILFVYSEQTNKQKSSRILSKSLLPINL